MKSLYNFYIKYSEFFLELYVQLALAIPIFFSQISMMLMGFVDVSMTGAVSAIDMAAVALGGSFWFPVSFFCQGMLYAISPIVAQLRGSSKFENIEHVLYQGLWLAFFLSFPVVLIIRLIAFQLCNMGIEPELAMLSKGYLLAISWGAPVFLFFIVIRCFLEGMGLTRPSMVTCILGLLTNILCNYVFIFGFLFVPALGGVGAGIATAIVYWVMFFILLYYFFKVKRKNIFGLPKVKKRIDILLMLQLIKIGFPGGIAMFIGVTSFAVVALLVAPLGIIIVAGHQIAINFGTLLYMFPSSISITATIRTGYALGCSSYTMIKRVSTISVMLGISIALIAGLLTFLFRYEIAFIYNSDPEVLRLATFLLIFVAAYQAADAIQVIATGILRGYNDTTALFYIIFFSYGLILPVGYILGRTDWLGKPMGVEGFWWAFVIGLILAATLGLLRVKQLEHNFYNSLKTKAMSNS